MVLVNTGFSDYYNDEYTRNGDCEFFCGPYTDFETARAEAGKLMDSFTYEDWAEKTTSLCQTSMSIIAKVHTRQ